MSFADIWAEPLVEDTNSRLNRSSATTETRPALFLSDSDDDDDDDDARRAGKGNAPASRSEPRDNVHRQQPPDKDKIDALFGNLEDDIFADVGVTDIEKLKRQAEAKVTATRGTLPSTNVTQKPFGESSSPLGKIDKGVKKKKEIPKLNEERLLGTDGFPRLLKEYKNFKPSGKGREAVDLERLFRLYHGWTHRLFPKYQFSDTVDRVEKLCRSRRMTVNLRVWRDEAHGINTENQEDMSGDSEGSGRELPSDDEHQAATTMNVHRANNEHISSSPNSSRPSTPMTRPSSVMSSVPSVPSSPPEMNDMDMDIDALLREEEELMREMGGGRDKSSYKPGTEDDGEEALWATMGDLPDMTPTSNEANNENDENLWSAVDTLTQNPTTPAVEAAHIQRNSEVGADWNDMYE